MLNDNQKRVALIAGGAGGIGLAIARRLGALGIRIAIADLDTERLHQATQQLCAEGCDSISISTNLLSVDECERAVRKSAEWHNRLDILVNAAGVWLEGEARTVTEEEWDHVLGVNLKGAFFLTRTAVDYLPRGGVVINIASDAGLTGNNGASVYCASKGGLVILTKALALEFATMGVRVNAVCPGDVDTPMIEYQAHRYGKGDPAKYKQDLLSQYPQKEHARFVRADEVARLVEYLCDHGAAAVTGAALSIDFGLTAGY